MRLLGMYSMHFHAMGGLSCKHVEHRNQEDPVSWREGHHLSALDSLDTLGFFKCKLWPQLDEHGENDRG